MKYSNSNEPEFSKGTSEAGSVSGGAAAKRPPLNKKSLIIIIVSAALVLASVIGVVLAVLLIPKQPTIYVLEMEVKDFGTIRMELDRESAPITVDNFVKLAEEDFYDGLTFHRAVDNFVIQGGDPKGDGTGGSPDKIFGEFFANGYSGNNIRHREGVISMARSNAMNSASSQFFITIGDARSSLDGSYAAFGYIDEESMKVVHAIADYMLPLTSNGIITDKAKQPVIVDVRVVETR